jgi:hypothetical protein
VNTYLPGDSVRFLASFNLLGVPYTPAGTITCTMHGPIGTLGPGQSRTTQTLSFVIDSVGQLHSDATIPVGGSPGQWVTRWLAVGVGPADSGLAEDRFIVQALSY